MARRTDESRAAAVRCVWLIARATLAEAGRLRALWLAGSAAVLLLAAGVGLRELHFGGAEIRFLLNLGFAAIGFGGTVVAVVGTAQLFFSDLESGLAGFVLSRPVPRTAWLCGKLGGVLVLLAALTAGLTAVLGHLVGWRARELGLEIPWVELACGAGWLWLRAAIAAAATLFVCTYARSALFASGAGLLFVLVGHLRPVAELARRDLTVEGLLAAVVRLWPDLQRFEPVGVDGPAATAAYGCGYLVLLVSGAALAFRGRDL